MLNQSLNHEQWKLQDEESRKERLLLIDLAYQMKLLVDLIDIRKQQSPSLQREMDEASRMFREYNHYMNSTREGA